MKFRNTLIGLAGLVAVACGGAVSQQTVASYDPNCRIQHIGPEVRLKECFDARNGQQHILSLVNGQEISEAVYDTNGVLIKAVIFEKDQQGNTVREHHLQSGKGEETPYLIYTCKQNGAGTSCRYLGEGYLPNGQK